MTTSFVLLECGNAAARKPYREDVAELWRVMKTTGDLIEPSLDELEQAWTAYRSRQVGDAGIVDHVSFLVMLRLGLSTAFTNDKHFLAAGFIVLF